MSHFVLPKFTSQSIAPTEEGFVSALSSPSIPTCVQRGTGTQVGKLVTSQITDTNDDGLWSYNLNFDTTTVYFGTTRPSA